MEQGVNLLANFPLSSPFFLTTEICGRPRKHINFAGKPLLKTILYGNGLTQGYSTYGRVSIRWCLLRLSAKVLAIG